VKHWISGRLYRWIHGRGAFPYWVRWLYPKAHFCPEMDEMLVLDNVDECYCGYARKP
jgi:hypothetical protein